jgi:predicted dehydrogenase
VDHCHSVVDAAARHRGLFWVAMEYRYMRAADRLIREVHDGVVGPPRMVAIREHRYPFLPKVENWNRFARNTGGTLVEKCCHFFDLMNLITAQRPTTVYASGAQDVNHLDETYDGEVPDIIDNAFTIVDYDGGARAMLDLCMFAENSLHEAEIAVSGHLGKVEAFEPGHEFVRCLRDGSEHVREIFKLDEAVQMAGGHHGSTYYEHLAFQEAIRTGGRAAVRAEDGALAVGVGAAAEQSIRERRPVELRELGF